MSSFKKQLEILRSFVNEGFVITDWFLPKESLKAAKKLQAAGYIIRYSKTKPTKEEWDIFDIEALRIGTFGGKWGGKSIDSNVNKTYRQKRRSVTTQGYDRIQGHYHNIEYGPESNEIKKNWGGAARAFAPVQARYGYGKKVMKYVWTQYIVPKENMDWPTQILRLEISELCNIWQHKNKFNGMAPLTDLKYASISQKEIQSLLSKTITTSARRTKIINDEDYAKGNTNNTNAFTHNLETLGFLTGKSV
tara:strand:+ start:120 stop:866 length:747 start_codon:yes stop_codon:yes gene_type:complete